MADNDVSREDRKLPASARKLQKAREEGNVARSRDFGHFAMLGGALLAMATLGPGLLQASVSLVRSAMSFARVPSLSPEQVPSLFVSLGSDSFFSLVPLLAVLAAASLIANIVPGGAVLSGKPLAIRLSKISPVSGLKRIFSVRGAVNLLKLMALAGLLIAVSAWFISFSLPEFAQLATWPLEKSLGSGVSLMLTGVVMLLGVLALIALVDVPFQWYRHGVDLRMTFEEVKQEAKESEGDPHVRGRIRARQREMATRRMLTAVPAADAVITNPTHYAVAIRYDEAKGGAPRVVAKGVDLVAGRIREVARAAGVPLVEAPPLARALYAHVGLDREIPAALYNAVAQILVYVYQLRNRVAGRDPAPRMPTEFDVPAELDPLADTGGAH